MIRTNLSSTNEPLENAYVIFLLRVARERTQLIKWCLSLIDLLSLLHGMEKVNIFLLDQSRARI